MPSRCHCSKGHDPLGVFSWIRRHSLGVTFVPPSPHRSEACLKPRGVPDLVVACVVTLSGWAAKVVPIHRYQREASLSDYMPATWCKTRGTTVDFDLTGVFGDDHSEQPPIVSLFFLFGH
ncbi:hypothetical protein L6452_19906 [Arctium lappa]|uniref:Uncharacterized protein n=1 Tax=Arctium lappa TaxID=4217 RepID=A0ACB9BAR7_ARCLA|nr:hypothetical protein L6452_19906 [Arctium lappa]